MSRLHIDLNQLAGDLDLALQVIARGGDVLLERAGQVVAALVAPGYEHAAAPAPVPPMPGDILPPPYAPDADAAAVAMDLLRTQAVHARSMEIWDELSREEELLEYLASEME